MVLWPHRVGATIGEDHDVTLNIIKILTDLQKCYLCPVVCGTI